MAMNLGAASAQRDAAKIKNDATPIRLTPVAYQKKLSHKDQRELDELPTRIEALEREQAALRAELMDANLYAKDPLRATGLYARDAAIEAEMLSALARWEALAGG